MRADLVCGHTGYDVTTYFQSAFIEVRKRPKIRIRRLWVEFQRRGVLPAPPVGGHLVELHVRKENA